MNTKPYLECAGEKGEKINPCETSSYQASSIVWHNNQINQTNWDGPEEPSPHSAQQKLLGNSGGKPETHGVIDELVIHISGLGPCGLITLLNLYYYFEPTENPHIPELMKNLKMKIICHERRFVENTTNFIPANDDTFDRRKQVVTLQNDVICDLPKEIQAIIKNRSEEIWRNSRNIPIYVFEDELSKFVKEKIVNNSNKKIEVEICDGAYNLEKLVKDKKSKGKFYVLMNCEGSNSDTKKYFGIKNTLLANDFGLGIFFVQALDDEKLARNAILTISQMRYLINSTPDKGFINVRLTEQEFKTFSEIQKSKKFFTIEDVNQNYQLYNIIHNGCKFFGIELKNVKGIMAIPISVEITNESSKFIEDQTILFNLGDSMMKVHFWPGRGLNSAIKTSVAGCRRVFQIVKNYSPYEIKDFLESQLNVYNNFCEKLVMREQKQRSIPIMERKLENSKLLYIFKTLDDITEFAYRAKINLEKTCNDILNRLKPLKNWKILEKIEKIELGDYDTLESIYLNQSQPWPLKEMSGEEIYPSIVCPDPTSISIKMIDASIIKMGPKEKVVVQILVEECVHIKIRRNFNESKMLIGESQFYQLWDELCGAFIYEKNMRKDS